MVILRMIKFNTRLAEHILLLLLAMVGIFHLLVVIGLVPYALVWGGRLASFKTAQLTEVFSFLISLVMLLIVAIHAGYLRPVLSRKVTLLFIRIFLFLFLLGTVGNLLSKNAIEQFVFAPITLVLTLCCLQISSAKNQSI